jgi:NADH:ubiquinone oxidoreductase subunit 5 (subunit L)/multisubunit Na+/H+ antiporter MnhA subunit
MMSLALILAVLAPVAGFFALAIDGLFSKASRESLISGIARYSAALQLIGSIGILASHADAGFKPFHSFLIPGIPLFIDWTAAVYMTLVGFIGWISVSFSDRYMHREAGFRRFFLCLMIFLFGMALIVLGGALDTLFIGWEIVGLASFLLVGFYLARPKAARHALRALLTYRLCDVGLLVGAILTHSLYHSGMFEVIDGKHIGSIASEGISPGLLLALSLLIFLAASGKAAQFPFSGWLPRAMEGPSPSSAVFYGSLSIHCGVYLLLRTEAIWGPSRLACGILFAWGAVSALLSRITGMVQSNVKGHVAWNSISHVGLMFCELALGWHVIAVIHVVLHSLYRCYQLLASQSTLAQHFREGMHFRKRAFIGDRPDSTRTGTGSGWLAPLYLAALNEFHVDLLFNRFVTSRFRALSSIFVRILGDVPRVFWYLIPVTFPVLVFVALEIDGAGLAGMISVLITAIVLSLPFLGLRFIDDTRTLGFVSAIFTVLVSILFMSRLPAVNSSLRPLFWGLTSFVALVILGILGDESRPIGWRLNAGFQGLVMLLVTAFWFCGEGQSRNCLAVLSGLGGGVMLATGSLNFMEARKRPVANAGFLGYATAFPRASILFLVGCLALVTFPFTAAFRGEDLILEAAFETSHIGAFLGGLVAVLIQLLIIRAMAQAYFGAPRHEVRYEKLDLGIPVFALTLLPSVAAFLSTLFVYG